MSGYEFGKSRARLPVQVLVDIRQSDEARRLRSQAARLLELAAESRDLLAARQELAAAKSAAWRAEDALLTFDERRERAEQIREAAFVGFGYDPVTCYERLLAATNERTKNRFKKGARHGNG